MSFSMVDSFSAGKLLYPETVERVLFTLLSELAIQLPFEAHRELMELFMFTRGDSTELMIQWARQHGLSFECPVCGDTGIRQEWELINDCANVLRDVPCYCGKPNVFSGMDIHFTL